MADPITIRERIERRIVAAIDGITNVGRTFRGDARGVFVDTSGTILTQLQNGDALVYAFDDEAGDETEGDVGLQTFVMPVRVGVVVAQDEADAEPGAKVANRWRGLIYEALMSDPHWMETTVPLALNTTFAASRVDAEPDGREMMVVVEVNVTYRTNLDDPYTGPAITQATE